MATVRISTLDYRPLSPESPAYVAQFQVNGGDTALVDLTTAIKMDTKAVPVRFITIDNSQGGGYVSISFNGNYRFTALPYTRDVFTVAPGLNNIEITADADVTVAAIVTISSDKVSEATDNQFLIQQVVSQVTFPIGPAETFSRVQTVNDNKISILFVTTGGAPINYSLMPAGTAGIAWMQGIFNEPAIGNTGDVVNLVTSGGELINGRASWAIPPGTGGFLMGSGIDWYFVGFNSDIRLGAGSAANPAYTFFLDPDTGLYRVGANSLGLVAGGSNALTVNPSQISVNVVSLVSAGDLLFDMTAGTNATFKGKKVLLWATGVGSSMELDAGTVSPGIYITRGQLTFPTIPNPSSDPNTLDEVERGSFTLVDVSGTGVPFTSWVGNYLKLGDSVQCSIYVVYPVGVVSGAAVLWGGLPFTVLNNFVLCAGIAYAGVASPNSVLAIFTINNDTRISFRNLTGSGTQPTNANFSGAGISGSLNYFATQ